MTWTKPSLPTTRPVAVLGAGVLGRRIAASWAVAGFHVQIRDPSQDQLTAAVEYIKTNAFRFNEDAPRDIAEKYIAVSTDLEAAVKNVFLVIECAPEKIELKRDIFADLEKYAPRDAILGTNSSSYKSRECTLKLKEETKHRVLNMHYMMPPDNRIVELMTCGNTDPDIFPFLVERLRGCDMLPVVAQKESTGFIINRVWAAIKREVLMVLAEGVAAPETVDAVWKEMFTKQAYGPCATMDGVGLDTVSFIEQHYIKERGLEDPGVIPFLQKYLDEGKLGAKSSKGGLYPPGYLTKTRGQVQGAFDNLHAPLLYFLDTGLTSSSNPKDWPRAGRILVGSVDGKAPLRTLVDQQSMPDGIAISRSAGRIFWTNMGVPWENDGSIMSCKLDGSDVKTVVPAGEVHTPKQTCIDEVNQKLYFSDREGMRVLRCDFDGSHLETLVETGDWTKGSDDQTLWCVGIAVAPKQGKFYWTQKGPSKGSKGQMFRAAIDFPAGTDAKSRTDIERLFDKLPEPIDLEVDEEAGALYWTDRGELPLGNSLNRIPFAALEVKERQFPGYEILARNLHEAIGLTIDRKNRHIYATDLGGSVYRFDMDGSNKKRFYDDQGSFTGIALYHPNPEE